jgi:ABC-2 type transport system permease protein
MPVTPTEIMVAKVWAMGLVVLAASWVSLTFVIRGALHVPIGGSVALFLVGTTLHLFAMTSMGIFMATLARTMPQFGLMLVSTLLPAAALGRQAPRGHAATRAGRDVVRADDPLHGLSHPLSRSRSGRGVEILRRAHPAGRGFFSVSLARFRRTIGQMA